ncbi:hypothetical protein NHX12_009512 [Muraenolepis orangiensis]|uniref:Beta-galactosidase n=1 Tax=Muraenolepis orangiensis TaxID=630683 RepID=A0A9Q0I8F9_9TELE|nr:hypothetical protein NHX12_009512 [Muraenolepis orangiensis]
MVVWRIRNTHKRKYVFICLSILGFIMYRYLGTPAGGRRLNRREGLTANTSQFTLGGEPFRILGGSVHYFRVPRAYWRDRLMKTKACGINTITTYVPWSLHQPERGVFNFHTQLDLESYISLAAELGLWVILRPGPYISAELDLGGLPSWLLQDAHMRLRTTYRGFTDAVDVFFDKLIPKIVPLQFKKGGPIIAVQLDNSYGSFAKDRGYMTFVKEALTSRGVSELLLTADRTDGLKAGGELNSVQPNSPTLVMECWSGMVDVWGDLHHVLAPEDMVSVVREILRRGMSVNLYMFHGGTSFGFMSGALGNPSYKAIVPSYDYDAPLSEAGEYTPKEAYETAIMYNHLSLWDALSFTEGPFKSPTPVNMENLPVNNKNGQSQGYTLYETTITSGGLLKTGDNVRDRAQVFVDRQYIGFFKRRSLEMAVPDGEGKRTLSLLVENCGRVHHGKDLDKQRKGLVGDVLLNGTPLRDFTIYSLDMKASFIDSLYRAPWKALPEVPVFPSFFMGALFAYGYPSDTFVKLPGWGKGVVFVNGLNLGRYWSRGPQQALYLPGPLLNSGMNQIIVFEEQEADYKIQLEETQDLGMAADIQTS